MVEGCDCIVVGVETLELSRNAIAWAVRQAAADGSRVRLVHAVDASFAGTLAPWGGEVPIELFPDQLRAAYQDELHKALAYARECGPTSRSTARSVTVTAWRCCGTPPSLPRWW